MDKLYRNQWVLRIFAFILALALYFYVGFEERVNENNTNVSTNDVEVITNVPLEAYYDKDNLIVSGLPETVDVTISGPSQIVLKTKLNKDFTVFVDLEDLMIGEHEVTIQHENISDKLEVTIDPVMIDLSVEEKVTAQFEVEPEMSAVKISDGFILDSIKVSPDIVSVTGAKSIIDKISHVKAALKTDSAVSESFEQESSIRVLNSDLNGLDVTINPDIVKVNVGIKEYSKTIPITVEKIGLEQTGISIVSLVPNIDAITVTGKKSIVDEMESLVVEFDVAEITKPGTYEAAIKLPEGVSSKTKTVKLKADVENSLTEQLEQENGTTN